MKIRNVSCTQFAGVRDCNVSFKDGINVIYGKNESGKSTLVNLISRTLFQNARVDGRTDKEFRNLYFPGARKGSSRVGDFVDGKISFETETGIYTLTKEWGTDARCILSTPDGVIRDQKTIDALLREALQYGEGVYADMLFSSQRNTDLALHTILDASKKTDAKQEIADAVSQAFAESDGISVDVIEQAINGKIEEIVGKHWDLDRNAPQRKAGRWSNGLGEILKAYYAMEDANEVLKQLSELEVNADRAANDYTQKDAAVRIAEEAFNRFNSFASLLEVQSERKKAVDRLQQELLKIDRVLSDWPGLAQSLEKARALQGEKESRELLDRHAAAKVITEEMARLKKDLPPYCPTEQEIRAAKVAQRSMASLENKLCGMNLTAAIRMLGGNEVQIRSLRTGEPVALTDGIASIEEAVQITVPGVMEMQLSPADVNVSWVESEIARCREEAGQIFEKYQVRSTEELEALAKGILDARSKLDTANHRLSLVLGATAFEELEEAVGGIRGDVRSKETIDRDILATCGSGDILRFVTAKETVMEGYAAEYGSINDLKAKAYDLEAELKKAKETVSGTEDIPAEYAAISDPRRHLEELQNNLKEKQRLREAALTAKTTAAGRLEGYKETVSSDPQEDAERATRAFEEQKSLLAHWQHIARVFQAQKESIHDHPMQDIANRFCDYLGIISEGKVSSEFPEEDKLNMNIYSENRLLDYGKLSEGTKETVSLAFRLAVLDHLFPEGGGVIVFDDPFTDMDADRTAQSCRLIQECAKRHQVIFLTCREDYLTELTGNHIFF